MSDTPKPTETALERLTALEREWPHVGVVRADGFCDARRESCHACQLSALLRALAEEQKAVVAAAYERAVDAFLTEYAGALVELGNNSKAVKQAAEKVRALVTADQRAALEQVKAQARLEQVNTTLNVGEQYEVSNTGDGRQAILEYLLTRRVELEAAVKRNADE